MKNKKYLIPLLGITTIATASAPIIASCSCSIQKHIWYSPVADKKVYADDDNKGLFICVLDNENYSKSDFNIKITGQYKDILTIDSFNVNKNTLEVHVKCLDSTIAEEFPFGLTISTKDWSEIIDGLTLVMSSAIAKIEITCEGDPKLILGGDNKTFTAKVYNHKGQWLEEEGVTWEVPTSESHISIVTSTTSTAEVKAESIGSSNLVARSITNPKVSKALAVSVTYDVPHHITLDLSGHTEIGLGEKITNFATAKVYDQYDHELTDESVTWSATATDGTVKIDSHPLACDLTGTKPGAVTLTATSTKDPNVKATTDFNVIKGQASSITITGANTVGLGETVTGYYATVYNEWGTELTDETVSWTTTPGTGSISWNDGNVTGVSVGKAKLTATCDSDSSITTDKEITVTYGDAKSLVIDDKTKTKIALNASATYTDKVYNIWSKEIPDAPVTWSSSNEKVLSITSQTSRSCTIKGVALGKATLTAKYNNDNTIKDSVDIEVAYSDPTSVVITSGDDTIPLFEKSTNNYVAKVSPDDAEQKVEWRIDPAYTTATITDKADTTCKVEVSEGTVGDKFNLYAVAKKADGSEVKSAAKEITITGAVATSMTITPETSDVWADETEQYYAKVWDKKGNLLTRDAFTWSITKGTTIVEIGKTTGLLTPRSDEKGGDVTISVTSDVDTELSAKTKNITVKVPTKSFSIKNGPTEVVLGTDVTTYSAFQMNADSVLPEGSLYDEGSLKFYSEDPDTIDVNETTGAIKSISKTGTTNIYAQVTVKGGKKTITSALWPIEVKYASASSITINQSATAIWTDKTATFEATSILPATTEKRVTWEIYDDAGCTTTSTCADIAQTTNTRGTVTPKTTFTFTEPKVVYIRAKAAVGDTYSNVLSLTINPPLTSFNVTAPESIRVGVDATATPCDISNLDPTGAVYEKDSVTYTVTNGTTGKATIDSKTGVLTAVAAGYVYVTATIQSETLVTSTNTVTVTVNPPYVTDLVIEGASNVWLDETSTTALKYAVKSYQPSTAVPDVKWVVENGTGVAEIDKSTGVLKPEKDGTVFVHAEAQDGSEIKSNTITVTIDLAPDAFTFTGPDQVRVGETATTPVVATPTATTTEGTKTITKGTIYYTIADAEQKYATVDSSGKVTGVSREDTGTTVKVYATWTCAGHADVSSAAVATPTYHPVEVILPTITTLSINGPDTISPSKTNNYSAVISPAKADTDITWSIVSQPGGGKASINSSTGALTADATTTAGIIKIQASDSKTGKTATKEVTITTSWTAIFKLGTTSTVDDTVIGFNPDGVSEYDFATLLEGYCTTTKKSLLFPTDSTVKYIAADAFTATAIPEKYRLKYTNIVIPANINTIGNNTFQDNTGVTSVQIDGAATIGDTVFTGCSGLTSLTAVNTVKIGTSAFEGTALTWINLGATPTLVIGTRAFADIKSASIALTANPDEIGEEAFSESNNLVWEGINSATNITKIGARAFIGTKLLGKDSEGNDIVFKPTVAMTKADIGDDAFYQTGITRIALIAQTNEAMYAKWGDRLFGGCQYLYEIDLSAWVNGIAGNLSLKENLFIDAGDGLEDMTKIKWYYPTSLEASKADFVNWMNAQISDGQMWEEHWSTAGSGK